MHKCLLQKLSLYPWASHPRASYLFFFLLTPLQGAQDRRHLCQQGPGESISKDLFGHIQQENEGLSLPVHEQWEYVHLISVWLFSIPSVPVSTVFGHSPHLPSSQSPSEWLGWEGRPTLVFLLVQNFVCFYLGAPVVLRVYS